MTRHRHSLDPLDRENQHREHRHAEQLHAEDHDRGLSHDLPLLLSRRRALTALAGVGLVGLTSCAAASSGSSSGASATSAPGTTATEGTTSSSNTTEEIPEETNGPYPADGSNGRNVLNQSGVVRSDIRSSFGTASGTVTGVPLTVTLTVLDLSDAAKPYEGAAVYAWHCTPDGRYSMYSPGIETENYLRGVQEADADGRVTFTTIYPGAYSGRWPHVHFEVYPSVDDAVNASSRLRTSQLAFPEDACREVYATDGYGDSLTNLSQTSLDRDMVFGDGYSLQLAAMTGSVADGYTARLNVPV